MSLQSYISIGSSEVVETKEKGSKFIGMAACCKNEMDVKLKLEEWHDQHPQATHICYAYRLGVNGEKYRANDDGEPSNSAGAPILGQILSAELTNVLVGVVRYYGGTKLGVGGLIQAYKLAAKEVLDTAERIEYQLCDYYAFHFGYDEMPMIMNVLKRNRLDIIRSEMADNCQLEIKFEAHQLEPIKEALAMFKSLEIKFLERK